MAAEIISIGFIFGAFFVGAIIGFFTTITGNPLLKIIDGVAIIAIYAGFVVFLPDANMTTEQLTSQITGIIMYLVNVVLPFIVGDAFSSAGYMLITGE